MLYFAYGSNMSSRRIRTRAPSATFITSATLTGHKLEFHKRSADGSAKCDMYLTGREQDRVIGVVFAIDESDKPELDRKEGLGAGYEEKIVELTTQSGGEIRAFAYYATHIDPALRPYGWYKQHVLKGAEEFGLPESYIEGICEVEELPDPDRGRHARELAIYE